MTQCTCLREIIDPTKKHMRCLANELLILYVWLWLKILERLKRFERHLLVDAGLVEHVE